MCLEPSVVTLSTASGLCLSWNAAAALRAGTARRWRWSRRSVCFCATTQYLTLASLASWTMDRLLDCLGEPAQKAICGGEDVDVLRVCFLESAGRGGPVYGVPRRWSWLSTVCCRRSSSACARCWRGEGAKTAGTAAGGVMRLVSCRCEKTAAVIDRAAVAARQRYWYLRSVVRDCTLSFSSGGRIPMTVMDEAPPRNGSVVHSPRAASADAVIDEWVES